MDFTLDTGATAWILTSAALVLLMTPGLSLFYGGMVRARTVLNMMLMSFGSLAVVSIIYVLWGWSMSYGTESWGGIVANPFEFFGLKDSIFDANGEYLEGAEGYANIIDIGFQLMPIRAVGQHHPGDEGAQRHQLDDDEDDVERRAFPRARDQHPHHRQRDQHRDGAERDAGEGEVAELPGVVGDAHDEGHGGGGEVHLIGEIHFVLYPDAYTQHTDHAVENCGCATEYAGGY